MRLPPQIPPVLRDVLISESYWSGGRTLPSADPATVLSRIGQELRNEINSIFTAVRIELPFNSGYRPVVSSSHIASPAVPRS